LGCVVLHKLKGSLEPCLIDQIQGLNTDQQAYIQLLPANFDKPIYIKDVPLTNEFFEIHRLPPLGYVDYGDASFYLSRRPLRGTKQGFTRGNINIPQSPHTRTPDYNNLVIRKEFLDMLKDRYESLEKTWEKISKSNEPLMRAVTKILAVSIDDLESVTLFNRGMKVGVCNNPRKLGPVFTLPKKFQYLKEEIVESGIRIA